MRNLTVNGERLWASLMELAQIGATEKGGVCRLAASDLGYETEAPIEIVAWTNEEGSRFSPAMVGSGVFAGIFDLAYGLARPDNVSGVMLGSELERIGFAGPAPVGDRPVRAYFEAHIE